MFIGGLALERRRHQRRLVLTMKPKKNFNFVWRGKKEKKKIADMQEAFNIIKFNERK